MATERLAKVRLSLLKHPGKRPTSKEILVAEFKHWDQHGRRTPATPRILIGLFYLRYKAHFRLYPISEIRDDLANAEALLRNFLSEDPALAPAVVEVFFTLKHFDNLKTSCLCNRNILAGWGVFEKARKFQQRGGAGIGEQAEFTPLGKAPRYGSIRI